MGMSIHSITTFLSNFVLSNFCLITELVFTHFQVLDMWHPLEKAAYPEYFKLRDKRKGEFIERWEKKYGKPDPAESAGH